MSGNSRVMRGRRRRDGRLARFHAIQKILPVTIRLVEFDLPQILRQLLDIIPFFIRRIKGLAIDMDPAVGSDPFGARF